MTNQRCKKCKTKLRKSIEYCPVCGTKVLKRAPTPKKTKRRIKADLDRRRRATVYAVVAVIGGALLLFAALALRPDPNQVDPVAIDVPDSHDEQGIPYPDVPRVTPKEAKEKSDAGMVIFLDVRSADDYEREHISNAISMPLADLEARYGELPQEAEIITYCT